MKRTMLITGATGGIGAAIVQAAAARDYRVFATGRDAATMRALPAEPLPLDLRTPGDLAGALPHLDHLDALVHCAGVADVASVEDTTHEQWTDTLAVNVVAAAEITRVLLPALRAAAGHVVFVNAAPGLHAVPRWSAYAASKTALRELADSLRTEETHHGVRVTTIYPGGTATDLLAKVRAQFGHPYDPAKCIQPATLASVVLTILEMRDDAYLSEVSVQSTPHGTPTSGTN
jgi:NADP-dependent 3-hydroxy acid dehydrogenase YdfG